MSTKNLPAFGGFASSQKKDFNNPFSEFERIISTDNLRIFVNKESNAIRLKNYSFNENKFLWNGGFGQNVDLNSFNPYKNDEKFILIEFEIHSLRIYTDHYSRIPLFYSFQDDILYFSNTLNMLLKLRGSLDFKVDYKGLLFYYNFGFSNYTNYLEKNIQTVSGGKRLDFNFTDNVFDQKSYYDIYNRVNSLNQNSLDQNVKLIDAALLKSTKKSLDKFNKIGVAMSGGVDSGYLAQKIHECGRTFNSYSIGYKDGYNEFDRVDYLAKELNFETKKIILDQKEIIDNYINVSQHSSYPVYFNNSILNFVYEAANRDNVEVIFDGDGADRMFLGSNAFLRLEKVLRLYGQSKKLSLEHLLTKVFKLFDNSKLNNLRFYFERFNDSYPFYGLRQLSTFKTYDKDFEKLLSEIALPKEIPDDIRSDEWKYFIMFSIYYFSPCFLHNQYELQVRHNIASNPQFWTDDLVDLALSIPVKQKLYKKTTKHVLREAAKTKIDNGYWDLSKIGLQSAYHYIQKSKQGKEFIENYKDKILLLDEYLYLKEKMPDDNVEVERLLPYAIWKENFL